MTQEIDALLRTYWAEHEIFGRASASTEARLIEAGYILHNEYPNDAEEEEA